jgi:hypothetical protein
MLLCSLFLHAQTAPQRTNTAAPEPRPSTVEFVRPILSDKCFLFRFLGAA